MNLDGTALSAPRDAHSSPVESAANGVPQPRLELETYIAGYQGRTRFVRLLFIAEHCPYLALDALRYAIHEAKSGSDVHRYELALQEMTKISTHEAAIAKDTKWFEKTKNAVKNETERLESELRGYKNNLIKESIRMGYQDLAQHFYEIGDMTSSAKTSSKMQDFLTTNKQFVTMVMQSLLVFIEQRNWYALNTSISRIWSHQGTKYSEAGKYATKLYCIRGLASLAVLDYRQAAECFLNAEPRPPEHSAEYGEDDDDGLTEVMSPSDIATYGGLCALACFSRDDLRNLVLHRQSFRSYLELEPHIKRIISTFITSNFGSCFTILDQWKSDYNIDIYLQPCLQDLYDTIKRRAFEQYLIPFSAVGINDMATAFDMDRSKMKDHIVQLIKQRELKARIDTVDDKLIMDDGQISVKTILEKSLLSAQQYEAFAHQRLVYMELCAVGLDLRSKREKDMGSQDPEAVMPRLSNNSE